MAIAERKKDFLGVGWTYPFQINGDGSIGTVAYEEDIRQSLRIILGTNPGERVMRPEFGAGLQSFVFEPLNTATIQLVKRRVEESLVDFEPRIELDRVDVTVNSNERNRLDIDVAYRIRATNTQANLVYPFYLEESNAP